ncbi:tetratricopeptide repeat protein, partial [Halieaceae bacterium]|nr:tetratricopeptide repeat protein [Halieaceae bacterium]
ERFMVDIDPLPSRDVADTRLISDRDAEALYHNNIAMEAFAEEDLETAWVQMVKALQLSPNMQQLWVNIGAIYRRSGQLEAAERSNFQALVYDRNDRSAMNNLVILYEEMGREAEKAYWVERVERYRDANPYYHAWLGDKAAEEGDWASAREHYDEALERKPGDSRLLYAGGLIRYQLDDLGGATAFITEAMEAATLRGDVETYRVQLEAVRRAQLAETKPR